MFKDAEEKIQIGSAPSGQRYVVFFFSLDSGDIYITDDHGERALCFGEYLLLISIQKLTERSDVKIYHFVIDIIW